MDTTFRPYALMTVGGRDYRLKISTQAAIDTEKKLGCSISRAWLRLDEVTVQTVLLQAALQGSKPDISLDEVIQLRDSFIDSGKTVGDLADIIKEVYICSGFMKREQPQEEAPEETASGGK